MRGRGEGSIRQRTRADGTTYWEARVRVGGRQVSFYSNSKSGAQARARQARADAERGAARPSSGLTVGGHMTAWLETLTVRARTAQMYRSYTRTWIIPTLGHIRLASLTPGHVSAMLAKVVAAGRSESTARRVRATLSVALHAAMLDHGLPRNVASLAKVPKSSTPPFTAEVPTPADARAIVAACAGSRIEAPVMFSIATGVRQGELLALRWQDVDADAGLVTITHAVDVQDGRRVLARPKTERAQRTLALTPLAIESLQAARAQIADDKQLADTWVDMDLVFPGPTGGIRDGSALTHTFQARLVSRGLPRYRWHTLRRVFAALLQDQGVPLERIRDLLGHSELRVTEGYAYVMADRLAADMSAIEVALGLNEGRMRV